MKNKYNRNSYSEILERIVSEKEEERISKKRFKELFENKVIDKIETGTFEGLREIHEYLFQDCYKTAGMIRMHDIQKGDTMFCRAIYLKDNLKTVSEIPHENFKQIIEKYVEMNIIHPFYEGNGRATRLWLDQMLIKKLGICIDWQNVDKEAYLSAMKRSVVNSLELKVLLQENTTEDIFNQDIFLNGINQSYHYENMNEYDVREL